MKDILYAEWCEDKQAYRLYEPYEPYRTITYVDDNNLNSFESSEVIVQWSHKQDILNRIKTAEATKTHAKKQLEKYPFSSLYKNIYKNADVIEVLLQKELDTLRQKGEKNNGEIL